MYDPDEATTITNDREEARSAAARGHSAGFARVNRQWVRDDLMPSKGEAEADRVDR